MTAKVGIREKELRSGTRPYGPKTWRMQRCDAGKEVGQAFEPETAALASNA
jgi:hypothetical protein